MLDNITELRSQIQNDLTAVTSNAEAEAFRLKHLVRKGTIAGLFDRMREVTKSSHDIARTASITSPATR